MSTVAVVVDWWRRVVVVVVAVAGGCFGCPHGAKTAGADSWIALERETEKLAAKRVTDLSLSLLFAFSAFRNEASAPRRVEISVVCVWLSVCL